MMMKLAWDAHSKTCMCGYLDPETGELVRRRVRTNRGGPRGSRAQADACIRRDPYPAWLATHLHRRGHGIARNIPSQPGGWRRPSRSRLTILAPMGDRGEAGRSAVSLPSAPEGQCILATGGTRGTQARLPLPHCRPVLQGLTAGVEPLRGRAAQLSCLTSSATDGNDQRLAGQRPAGTGLGLVWPAPTRRPARQC